VNEVHVFLLMVTAYFLLACLSSWIILFRDGREFFLATLAGSGRRVLHWLLRVRMPWLRYEQFERSWRQSLRDIKSLMRRNYLPCIGGITLITIPPLAALLFGVDILPKPGAAPVLSGNPIVVSILNEVELVAPRELPPMVFSTVDVKEERPDLEYASRDWKRLKPEYTALLLKIFKKMEEHGYTMAILEGYRSPERQNALAAMGPTVTNAAAFQSWHQYGLAADCAFLRDGKIIISDKDPWAMRGYQLYGEVVESLGLVWGGRWKMKDLGHAELRQPKVMQKH
jgi:peptidoglycan LD-endopeptidase CwlK